MRRTIPLRQSRVWLFRRRREPGHGLKWNEIDVRHGEDETKHGRMFASLLKKRGLDLVDVPAEP